MKKNKIAILFAVIILCTCFIVAFAVKYSRLQEEVKLQQKEISGKTEQQTEDEESTIEEFVDGPSVESYELFEFVLDKLSGYNSWIGKTSKGNVYINNNLNGRDTYLIYITDKEKIYLRIALLGAMWCDVETGEASVSLSDDGTDYDSSEYLIKASDSELQLNYERTEIERDNKFPPELKNITLKKQKDGYILAAQSYLRENVNSYKESLSRIEYKKKNINKSTFEVVITGLYETNTERKREYKKKLVITKVGDEYKVE